MNRDRDRLHRQLRSGCRDTVITSSERDGISPTRISNGCFDCAVFRRGSDFRLGHKRTRFVGDQSSERLSSEPEREGGE
jgi:hypothetical protein